LVGKKGGKAGGGALGFRECKASCRGEPESNHRGRLATQGALREIGGVGGALSSFVNIGVHFAAMGEGVYETDYLMGVSTSGTKGKSQKSGCKCRAGAKLLHMKTEERCLDRGWRKNLLRLVQPGTLFFTIIDFVGKGRRSGP